MAQYLVKRVLGALPVFFGITLLVFFLMNMAPATIADLAGGEDASSAAARAALEANLGLDQPLPVRYVLWLKELLTGDLGLSYRTGQPVLGMIAQRVGPSLILTGTGVAAAVVIGIPLGVMAAWKPRSLWSRLAGGLTLLSFSAPGFFLCVLAIFFFSVVLGWLPAAGMYSAAGGGGLGDLLRHLVLPASVVCLSSLGNLVRQTASACGEVLGEDYIRTARAKGLPEWAVVWKHGFRTALLPVVTTILNHIPHIIGGSLVVERIFGWPGMGSLLFTSVSSRDYTVIMGLTVVIALTVLATGILMDLVYRLVDPGGPDHHDRHLRSHPRPHRRQYGHLCGLCLRGNPRQHHRAPGPCDPRGDHHSSCLQNSQYPLAKPEGQRTLLRPAPRLRRPDWRSGFFCVRGLIVQHGTGPCSPLALYPAVRNHADCDESSQAERASLCLLHRSCRSGRYCFSNGGLNELR